MIQRQLSLSQEMPPPSSMMSPSSQASPQIYVGRNTGNLPAQMMPPPPQNIVSQMSSQLSNQLPGNMPSHLPNQMPSQITGPIGNHISGQITGQMTGPLPAHMSGQMLNPSPRPTASPSNIPTPSPRPVMSPQTNSIPSPHHPAVQSHHTHSPAHVNSVDPTPSTDSAMISLNSNHQGRSLSALSNQVDTDIVHSNSEDADHNMAQLTPEDMLEKFVEQM